MVTFRGHDVDLLLANKAELLLAMEQLTMEMLRMTRTSIRACCSSTPMIIVRCASRNLRLSALTAAEKVKKSPRALSLQPDDEPGAPDHSPRASRGLGCSQRDRRIRVPPPGDHVSGGHAIAAK